MIGFAAAIMGGVLTTIAGAHNHNYYQKTIWETSGTGFRIFLVIMLVFVIVNFVLLALSFIVNNVEYFSENQARYRAVKKRIRKYEAIRKYNSNRINAYKR